MELPELIQLKHDQIHNWMDVNKANVEYAWIIIMTSKTISNFSRFQHIDHEKGDNQDSDLPK